MKIAKLLGNFVTNLHQGGGGRIRRLPTVRFRSVREGGGGREGHRRHGPDQDLGELNAEPSSSICSSVAETVPV